MCTMPKNRRLPSINVLLLIALGLGLCSGFLNIGWLNGSAHAISDVVINILKLISLPMIFLSVVSTISGMRNMEEVRTMGKKVLVYALGTTFVAALIGLVLFMTLNPASAAPIAEGVAQGADGSYLKVLLNIFPSNVAQAFLENHVIGVMLMAVTLGLATLTLKKEPKETLHGFFHAFFAAVLKITHWLVYMMPIGVWAFVTIFVQQMRTEDPALIQSFFLYIVCVLGANVVQGFVILPLFLKWKKVSPLRLAKGSLPALTLAFFTRSSNATLPVTLQCAEERIGLSKRVSNFSLPLCATINMNACASFILVTVMYVATSSGLTFGIGDGLLWAVIATIAAVGNAGVAMGCYFLASALLASMNVPLTLLGMILPIYALFDMVETSLNVWSDICITAVADKELQAKEEPAIEAEALAS